MGIAGSFGSGVIPPLVQTQMRTGYVSAPVAYSRQDPTKPLPPKIVSEAPPHATSEPPKPHDYSDRVTERMKNLEFD